MSRANIRRTIVDRVRITGLQTDVDETVNRLQKSGGYRWIHQRWLRTKAGGRSETRMGATLERPHEPKRKR